MPTTNKLDIYNTLAHATAKQLAHSQTWMRFLRTSGRLYKYSYSEQVLIYAQRPEATACAGFDFWKRQMGRFVRGGSTGIALVRRSHVGTPTVQYVFDIEDTGAGRDARRPFLWRYQKEHSGDVAEALEKRFGVAEDENFAGQIVRIAVKSADDYWQDFNRKIKRNVQDSILEDYDDDNLRMVFRNAAVASVSYAVLSRCGISLDELFAEEDFQGIFEFNSPEALGSLGEAVSVIAEEILRTIEDAIRMCELKKLLAKSIERQAAPTNEAGVKKPAAGNVTTVPSPAMPMKKGAAKPDTPTQNNTETPQPRTELPETVAKPSVEEVRTMDTAEKPVAEEQPETIVEAPAEESCLEAAAEVSVEETQTADTVGENSVLPIFLSWNYHITDDSLGVGGEKTKYQCNAAAIRILKQLESKGFPATLEEQEILSRYVGWGGIPDVFDPNKAEWAREHMELKELLTEEEYVLARASVLNAHYTSPTVIRAIYDAIGNMGFKSGNILEITTLDMIQSQETEKPNKAA